MGLLKSFLYSGRILTILSVAQAFVTAAKTKPRRWEKRVDETLYLSGRRPGAVLKEEVWFEGEKLVKYSLGYINSDVCSTDHGRVLGYDNAHGVHHRHFRGKVETFEFTSYEALVKRFEHEVQELWRIEDEK
jgi:hypothetical protein